MKMYSKEGQCMVDVRRVERDGDNIVMTAKLMGAYSMKIYLRPEELREALKLVNWELLSGIPELMIKGTRGEDTLRTIGANLASLTGENVKLVLGPNGAERICQIGKVVGINTMESLVENGLLLLQVILENKEQKK